MSDIAIANVSKDNAVKQQYKMPLKSRAVHQLKRYMNIHKVEPVNDKMKHEVTAKKTSATKDDCLFMDNASQQQSWSKLTETIHFFEKAIQLIAQQSQQPAMPKRSNMKKWNSRRRLHKKIDGNRTATRTYEYQAYDIHEPFTSPAMITSDETTFSNTILDTIKEAHEENELKDKDRKLYSKGGEGHHKYLGEFESASFSSSSISTIATSGGSNYSASRNTTTMKPYLSSLQCNTSENAPMVNSRTAPAILSYTSLLPQRWNTTRYDLFTDEEIQLKADAFVQRLERALRLNTSLTSLSATATAATAATATHKDVESDENSSYFDSDDDYMPEIHDDDYKIPYVDGPTAVDYSLHEKSQSAAPLIITGNGNMDNPKRSDIPLCENILPLKLQNNHSQVSVVSTSDSVCELRDDNDPKQPSTDTILALDEKIRYYVPTILPKKLTHCKVTKITNHSSAKDHMYELFVQLNNKTVGVYSGVLSKIDKGISTDIPVGEPLIFNDLQWPFTFNFIVTATPLKKKNIVRQAFTKINTWNHPPSYLKRNVKRIGTGKCMASPAAVIQKDHPQQNNTSHQLPIFGYAYLLFDSYRNDLLNGGECTLKIHQCVDRRRSRKLVDLELSVIFDEEEILPTITRPSSSSAAITTTDTITRLSEEENLFSFNERIQKETRQSLDTFHNSRMAKTYCQHGDYLTFYTRGTNSPVWIRYWVVLRGAYLVVYDFGYKDKRNPITIIPLVPLLAVSQSSLDDCEEFGLMRSKCFTLNFNRASVVVNKPHHPTTFTDCKAFVKCDDERSSAYWRSAISTQLKDLPNDIKSKEGIEAAFLW